MVLIRQTQSPRIICTVAMGSSGPEASWCMRVKIIHGKAAAA